MNWFTWFSCLEIHWNMHFCVWTIYFEKNNSVKTWNQWSNYQQQECEIFTSSFKHMQFVRNPSWILWCQLLGCQVLLNQLETIPKSLKSNNGLWNKDSGLLSMKYPLSTIVATSPVRANLPPQIILLPGVMTITWLRAVQVTYK